MGIFIVVYSSINPINTPCLFSPIMSLNMKVVGLSYDDQIWAYGLSLYRFSQTRDDSNLMRDKHVLRRLIAIGLFDNDAFQNSLPTRRAMMHSVVMAERL